MKTKTTFILALIAGLAVLLIDRLVSLDTQFNSRWLFFFSWVGVLLFFMAAFFWPELVKFFHGLATRKIKFKIDPWFVLIIVAVLGTRFLLINNYPFPTIGDELRDGGLDAVGIATGTIRNIFYYGRYESHGLIIPTFASFFYPVFGNTSLLFRVPAALIGSLDILLLYQLVKRLLNKKVAVIAALILTGMPLHLYYSRTELVVIFSSLMTTVSLWFFYIWVKNGFKMRHLAALGLILGLTMNFHGSVRIVAYILILLALGFEVFHLVKGLIRKYPGHMVHIAGICSFIVLIFAGFGPRLVYSTTNILFQTSTIPFLSTAQDSSPGNTTALLSDVAGKVRDTLSQYPQAFLVYFYEPTQFHYADHQPILPLVAGFFLLSGVVIAIIRRKKEYIPFLVLFFLLPLTNSAMTNCLNCDHRLAPTLPVLAIFTAWGVVEVCQWLRKVIKNPKLGKAVMIAGLIVFVIAVPGVRTVGFFQNEPASDSMFRIQRKYLYQDFMATYIKNDLRDHNYQGNICIWGDQDNYDYFNLMHVKEMFQFYDPEVKINLAVDNTAKPNAVYISKSCDPAAKPVSGFLETPCDVYQKYYCPIDHSKFSLYYSRDLF